MVHLVISMLLKWYSVFGSIFSMDLMIVHYLTLVTKISGPKN